MNCSIVLLLNITYEYFARNSLLLHCFALHYPSIYYFMLITCLYCCVITINLLHIYYRFTWNNLFLTRFLSSRCLLLCEIRLFNWNYLLCRWGFRWHQSWRFHRQCGFWHPGKIARRFWNLAHQETVADESDSNRSGPFTGIGSFQFTRHSYEKNTGIGEKGKSAERDDCNQQQYCNIFRLSCCPC